MIEMLVGIVIFAFLVMAANSYLMVFMKANCSIKDISQATSIGNSAMEKLRSIPYSSLAPDSQTVNQKFKCIWNVNENPMSQIKIIDLIVKWPQSLNGKVKEHCIQLSTMIAR